MDVDKGIMITGHMLVKNEENFLWYSVMSVIEYIDKLMIWDTGSTDNTKEIIKILLKTYPEKITFKEIREVNENEYTEVRQKMLNETKDDWIFILDGDEIWWEESIKKVSGQVIKYKNRFESIIVPTINLVGDIFHYQQKNAGRYKFGNRIGHYNLRFVNRNIPGLHVSAPYGKEGYFDSQNKPIQNREQIKINFINAPYIHATHLIRSNSDNDVIQRNKKLKHEIGIQFPRDFYFPESFFIRKPRIVPNIWNNMNFSFKFRSYLETPLRKLKRRLV